MDPAHAGVVGTNHFIHGKSENEQVLSVLMIKLDILAVCKLIDVIAWLMARSPLITSYQ